MRYDIAIVGGGAVGCSIAKHLAEIADLEICILEKEHHLAQHQSGRNSGVLHPGFNYPPGSLKARFATEGTRRMKAYCTDNDIPMREFGVLVVATDPSEEKRLHEIQSQADKNDVETELLTSSEEIREHEPHAAGQAALYAPQAASVDSQKYVYTLAKDVESLGVNFYMGYEVRDVRFNGNEHHIRTTKGNISATYLINAAGLYADRIAHQLDVGLNYQIVPFRGEYYELVPEKRPLVNAMIYPTPDPELPFLGVHFTRRTDDKVIVGPNAVLAFGREAYKNTQVDLGDLSEIATYEGFWKMIASRKMLGVAQDELNKSYRKSMFVEASRKLVPEVQNADFVKSYAGIRAQMVSDAGELMKDPLFEHGPNSTHVLNAVSPGLTSSLPFGQHITDQVVERL